MSDDDDDADEDDDASDDPLEFASDVDVDPGPPSELDSTAALPPSVPGPLLPLSLLLPLDPLLCPPLLLSSPRQPAITIASPRRTRAAGPERMALSVYGPGFARHGSDTLAHPTRARIRATASGLDARRCPHDTTCMRWPWLAALTSLLACGGDSVDAAGGSSSSGAATGTSTSSSTGSESGGDSTSSTSRGDSSSGAADSSSESSGTVPCPANAAPAAPTILEPAAGRIDVIGDDLVIDVSDFVDPDPGDALGVVAAEIWTLDAGLPKDRVWSIERTTAGPFTLADGVFDDTPSLEPWTDYVVRARHADDHAQCSAYGEWSEPLGFRTDDGSTELFDESVVRDFYLDIGPQSWDAINAQAYPPGCVPFDRDYHTGTLRYEDQVFDGVGIKIKGGCGSSRSLDGKASFKVNLEWDDPEVLGCPPERRLLGEKSFAFHNGVQDHTASHERLGYALYRALGVPAPRAASVRIFVNDELWGLYTHVESIDRRFFSRWFGSKEGMLYEGTYWCDLIDQNIGPGDNDDGYCLTREFSPSTCSSADPDGDPLDYVRLHELIGQIAALPDGGFYPAVEEFMDWDRFMTSWAIEGVLAHWDNYAFYIINNYRVYHDPSTGLWTLLSTGIDQTFNSDLDPWEVTGVLAVRCLQEPACEAAFAARLAEVNDAFENFGYHDRADAIFEQLSPYIEEDPRKEYSFGDFANEHDGLSGFIDWRPGRVRDLITAHGF